MKNHIIPALAAILLTQTIYASDHTIYVKTDSINGEAMMKEELIAKKDLLNTASTSKDKYQVKENSCDINTVKKAVAKIIKRLDVLEKEKIKYNFEISYLKKKLSEKNNVIPTDINSISAMASETSDFSVTSENISHKKTKVICRKKTKKVIDKKDMEKSYYLFETPKEFKVWYSHAYSFKLPLLNSDKKTKYIKGQKFTADLYTAAGWVHSPELGWFKGYKLLPNFQPNKEILKKWSNKNNIPSYKTIVTEDCKTIKIK